MNKVSSFMVVKNAIKYEYPFIESIKSIFDFSDEIIILDGYSNDGTYEKLKELAEHSKKIIVKKVKTIDNKGNKIRLDSLLNEAMNLCKNEWCFYLHPDEVILETRIPYIKALLDLPIAEGLNGFSFKFFNFFENSEQILWYPVTTKNEIYFYQNAIRLFKKREKIEFFGNGWEINRYKGKFMLINPIYIHHYHFMRSYTAISKEFLDQPGLCHFVPKRYEAFVFNEKNKRIFVNDIKPFNGPHPKFMKKKLKSVSTPAIDKDDKIQPKILFIMDPYYQIQEFIDFLPDIYNTGIIQKEWQIHELRWELGKSLIYQNGINKHYIPLAPAKEDETFTDRLKKNFYSKIIRETIELIRPDVILFIGRIPFFVTLLPILNKWKGNIIGWFEVDQENIPSDWVQIFNHCQQALVFSEFGKNNLSFNSYPSPIPLPQGEGSRGVMPPQGEINKKAGLQGEGVGKRQTREGSNMPAQERKERMKVIPVGVDNTLFSPVKDAKTKKEFRTKWKIPTDATLFLCTDSNEKSLFIILSAYEKMCNQSKDARKAYLYLHGYISLAIKTFILDNPHKDRILWSLDYNAFSFKDYISLYHISDAFISASYGEGTGIYLKQAISCGLPCILPDNSLFKEVVKNDGILIPTVSNPEQSPYGVVFYKIPDIDEMSKIMLEFYHNPDKRIRVSGAKNLQTWDSTSKAILEQLNNIIEQNPLVAQFD